MLSKLNLGNYRTLSLIQIPGNKNLHQILADFIRKASTADELKRLELAKEFCQVWKRIPHAFPFPAVPERNDYWYIAQLLFTGRHIHKNDKPYKWRLDQTEEALVENFWESDYNSLHFNQNLNNSLLGLLFQEAERREKQIPGFNLTRPTRILKRAQIDLLLLQSGDKTLRRLGLDPNEYKIINIPFDIYLRLANKMKWGRHILNTHFDGYRLRTDGIKTGLFGGNKLFGGESYIDSLWKDSLNNSIITRLAILRKDYGL